MRNRALATVLAATGGVVVLVAGAAPAYAHNVLVTTSPAAGADVDVLPDRVVLTFDQPALALGTELRVTGPGGDVSDGSPQLVDDDVTQPLRAGAPPGPYTVTWRVTSADGHPITGRFAFTARSGSAGPDTAATTRPASPAATTAPTSGADAAHVRRSRSLGTAGVAAVAGAVAGTAIVVVGRRRKSRQDQA